MIHEVFFVLSIVGTIILSIIGIALLLISLVLLVPVRYNVIAKKRGDFFAQLKITWLFHIVTAKIIFQDELKVVVKIFGIPIYGYKKEKEKVLKEAERNVVKKEKELEDDIENAIIQANSLPDTLIKDRSFHDTSYRKFRAKQEEKAKVKGNLDLNEKIKNNQEFEDKAEINQDLDKKSKKNQEVEETPELDQDLKQNKITLLGKRIKDKFNFVKKLKVAVLKWFYGFKRKYLNVKDIGKNISSYIDIWNSECCKEIRFLLKKQLIRIWKMIKPKKLIVWLHIGLDDPSNTGQVLVWYSILYPILGQNITIQPEFEEKVLEFEAVAKGKVTVVILLIIAIKIYFNKNLKKLINLLKKETK